MIWVRHYSGNVELDVQSFSDEDRDEAQQHMVDLYGHLDLGETVEIEMTEER